MWEQDWALLGLEPTTELGAIKKAYALKLKLTRPDDDADAYQALRAAYERVQQWLRWQQQQAAEETVAAATPAPAGEPAATVIAAEPLPPPEPRAEPAQLIEALALQWRRSGETAALQHWPLVQRELDQQPLDRQAEFSAAFAHWVLNTPALPDELLKALNQHFGWLDDFRTERLLGAPLTHALHEALEIRLRPPPLPEQVRELGAPLLALAALHEAGGAWWRLQWLFFLLQPTLARHQDVLGIDWLQRLGLSALTQRWLADTTRRHLWVRVGLAALLCWGAGLLVLDEGTSALARSVAWLAGTAGVLVAGLLAGGFISVGPTLTSRAGRLTRPLQAWRRHRSQPWLGLAWLLFAAWLCHLHATPGSGPAGSVLSLLPPSAYGYAATGFAIAGLLLAWPLGLMRGCVVAGLAPLVGWLAAAALGAWLPLPGCLLIGLAWMLAAAAIHEERVALPESVPVRWLVRPMLNSFALADRWTYLLAMAPVAVSGAWFALNDGEVGALRIFVVWVVGILAIGWLQLRADALGLRQLPAPQADAR